MDPLHCMVPLYTLSVEIYIGRDKFPAPIGQQSSCLHNASLWLSYNILEIFRTFWHQNYYLWVSELIPMKLLSYLYVSARHVTVLFLGHTSGVKHTCHLVRCIYPTCVFSVFHQYKLWIFGLFHQVTSLIVCVCGF